MKAVYIQSQGGVDVLQYGELPEPVIGPHEVKVRVRACALNRVDTYIRAGIKGTKREFLKPHILGADVAGDVVQVGAEVTGVEVGQRVLVNPVLTCGRCGDCLAGRDNLCPHRELLGSATSGGYAEYVKVPGVNVRPIPPHLSYEEAAALPTTFMPVWNMLVRRAGLKPWETVLVLSASSGVGNAAIQVAKKVIGARVLTTTSTTEKASQAREVGADEVILYTQEDVTQRVMELTGGQGVDVVVDHVGAEAWDKAFNSLKRGGRYGICGVTTGHLAQLHMGLLFLKEITVFGVYMGTKEDFREIVEMAARGVIRGRVFQVFPLEEASRAHQIMEERSFFGKLVLVP